MIKRIMVALALLPVLVVVLYMAHWWGIPWVLPAAVAVFSSWCVLELLAAGKAVKRRPAALGAVAAACVPFLVFFAAPVAFFVLWLFVLVAALFIEAINDRDGVSFSQVSVILFAAVVIPAFFSSLVRIALMRDGIWLELLPFLAAFGSDICALFTGLALGKHRLAPDISPKKTVEGAIGGLLGALLFTTAYNFVIAGFFMVSLPWIPLLATAFLGALASQLGDLSFSLIKRERGVKDFGRALPGHGGVLDRFDGLLFAAPVVELCIVFLNMGVVR